MATNHQPEQRDALKRKARRDHDDGWERGYASPYPKEMEAIILANIEKVSSEFVQGYRGGKLTREFEDRSGHIDDEEEMEWWDKQYKNLYG
mgnify:CR=1 FL=1